MFERIFILKGHLRGKQERCFQFSSMGWVLESPHHFRSKTSLSCWCRKPRQTWNSKGAHKANNGECNNDNGSKSDQEYRSRVI